MGLRHQGDMVGSVAATAATHGGSCSARSISSCSTRASTAAAKVLALTIVTWGAGTVMELWSKPQPLRVDPTLMSWALLTGLLALLIGWECVRWVGLRTIEQYGPGSAERRQRRLLRLREQTAAMIETELRQRTARPEPKVTSSQTRKRCAPASRRTISCERDNCAGAVNKMRKGRCT